MQVTTIGLDIAKRVFQVHGVDCTGAVVIRKKLRRSELAQFFAHLAPCLIGIEACATAHHWARELMALGHQVRLVPPSYVKAYLKRGKNDAADAEAICEAVTRPTMRFVPVKSEEQQGVLVLHRGRELLVRQRTMLAQWLARPHGGVRNHCAARHPACARAGGDAEGRDDGHSADCPRGACGHGRADQQSYDKHPADGEAHHSLVPRQ
jgi:transposase